MLCHDAALDLAGGRAGQLLCDKHALRHFEFSDMLSHKLPDLLLSQLSALIGHDGGIHLLAVHLISNSKANSLGNPGTL
ncbi:hypothetical protein GGI05_004539 [Coemansia sp. RSA 2603]|nr:hypothetical protein GGI05_004539 [Coemansia sp. RSA 2603]